MDVELPGIAPAPDNGWNNVYTSPCSGVIRPQSGIPAAGEPRRFQRVRRLHHRPLLRQGGRLLHRERLDHDLRHRDLLLIPNTYEWTYEPETTNYTGGYPSGWCLNHGSGPCAQFFGGQTSSSSHALSWQWSGGGGATNGIGGFNGDLDQIDSSRMR